MTLVWPSTEARIVLDKPRLHAFVVAVGDYPHLLGGSGAPAADAYGLSQVTTTRYTGPRIAKWIRESHVNTTCPLGSLEVLLSPSAAIDFKDGPVQVERATMFNIEAAFKRWLTRCSSQPGNTSLVYFCGHGFALTSKYFLPEDFGNPALPDVWENCIDLDAFRVGMRACKARTQIFFFDACRDTPFNVLMQIQVKGKALVSAKFGDPAVPCSASYSATTDGRKAYGPDDDITFFARAVMHCFDGVAALRKGGKWVIDTYSLGNALGQTMDILAKCYKLPLTCAPEPNGMGLIHEPTTPRVVTTLSCKTGAANDLAEFRLSGTRIVHSPKGGPRPLFEVLEAGKWRVEVGFPGGEYANPPSVDFEFAPPVADEELVP